MKPISERITLPKVILGDHCEVLGGKRLPKGYELTDIDTGYPYIRVTNFSKFSVDARNIKYVPSDAQRVIARYVINSDDVYISIAGTIGQVGMVPIFLSGSNLTENAARIVVEDGFNPGFLMYQLASESLQKQIKSKTIATTQAKLGLFRIKELEVIQPPLPEQKRIADKLDTVLARVDACRDRLNHVPLILKRFRQSVLVAATSGQLTADWRESNTGGQTIHISKFQNKRLSSVITDEEYFIAPENWQWTRLGNVVTLINGDRGKNYPNQSEYVDADNGIPFINTGHIEPDGSLSLPRMNYITREKFNSLGSGKIRPGDLVYCLRGATMGKTAFVNPFEEGAIASSLVIIRPSEPISPKFAFFFLTSPYGKQLILKHDNGTAQPNLSAGSLANYAITIPPNEEQHEIVRRVETLFAFADRLEARLATARAATERLTPALLAKAFRGELVPQDPNDEPAAALLQRLAASRAEAGAKPRRARAAKI